MNFAYRVLRCYLALPGLVLFTLAAGAAPQVTMSIDAGKPVHSVSPNLYGVFFEDINYAADGGLYAEMIQNRSFEFAGKDALFGWTQVEREGAIGSLSIETERPLNKNNPHYLRMAVADAGEGLGVANHGFNGIPIKQGSNYLFSVHARALNGVGNLSVELVNTKGKTIGAANIVGVNPGWNKYTSVIRASGTESNASLVIVARTVGTMDLDMISLFPDDTFKKRPNGLRGDLAQMVANLKPSFVRFPGGCIVEGKDLANRYRWKDTVGDVAERKGNWNRWQSAMSEAPAPQYYQSYGLGFYEFFQFCEDIGAQPLPVLNCGMSCQFQDNQLVPMEDLEPYVQDALDLIEFANGSEYTPWGAKRAAMGHPEPFRMKFLAIGNEQWGDDYVARYEKFAAAIKAKRPEIRIIASAGPDPSGEKFNNAWTNLVALKADIVDEHYYKPPSWFFSNAGRYDNYDRNGPSVFAGEYAAHTSSRRNNLEAALSEAAFMTGLERNSDVVEMASYAPLFARQGFTQWDIDLIWFDKSSTYGTPSYYVQQLFSCNRGDILLPTTLSDTRKTKSQFFATASRNVKTGQVIIKAVNPGEDSVNVEILLAGLISINSKGQSIVLSGKSVADENSFKEPVKIAPVTDTFGGVSSKFHYRFKPYSVTILRIDAAP